MRTRDFWQIIGGVFETVAEAESAAIQLRNSIFTNSLRDRVGLNEKENH